MVHEGAWLSRKQGCQSCRAREWKLPSQPRLNLRLTTPLRYSALHRIPAGRSSVHKPKMHGMFQCGTATMDGVPCTLSQTPAGPAASRI